MAGTFLSVGSMTSALTRSQVVSFILAVVACLFLILAGFAPVTAVLSGWAPMWLVDLVSATSVLSHFASIARGVLDVRDLLYYLSVMAFMIFVNGVILQNRESA
jgi:ABC-2 type transport system permease protein